VNGRAGCSCIPHGLTLAKWSSTLAKADRKNSAIVPSIDNPDELTRRRPIKSFLEIEAELNDLEPPTSDAAAKAAEVQIWKALIRIKAICNLAFPGRPFGDRFVHLLSNRLRSTAHFAEYSSLRDFLLNRLREVSEEQHKQASEDHRRRCAAENSDRNRQMAEAFLSQKSNQHSQKSDSAMKAEIGKKLFGLSRSTSIVAINQGLKSLSKQR
jgi:hypothetical protein